MFEEDDRHKSFLEWLSDGAPIPHDSGFSPPVMTPGMLRVGYQWFLYHHESDSEFIERSAARVHSAWMAEKRRQGFADHPFAPTIDHIALMRDGSFDPRLLLCCEKPQRKHHPAMVPFEELSDATKEYDRATVRAVLAALIEEERKS